MIHCERKSLNFPAIYRLEYKPAKLSYIGQSICFGRRLNEHRRTIDSPDSDCLWVRILRSRYGQLSFSDDFDVYILDYLDSCDEFSIHDELNRLEVLRIEEYGTWDPTFSRGLNYTKGGASSRPLSRTTSGTYYKAYTTDANNIRNTCLVYNIKTGEIRQFLSLTAAAKSIGTSRDNIRRGYYSVSCVLKTYIVVSTIYKKRKKMYEKYIEKQIEMINNASDASTNVSLATAAIKRVDAFIDIEKSLRVCGDKDLSRSDYLYIISDLINARREFKRIYNCNGASELRINDDTPDVDEEDSVAVYDTHDGCWIVAPSLRAVGNIIGLRRKNILETARTYKPYANRYYIYYTDLEARKAIYGKLTSSKIPKEDWKLLWEYITHYHELNKILGVRTIRITEVKNLKQPLS